MNYVICAHDGSASAWPSATAHRFGFIGRVSFCTGATGTGSLVHECARIRDSYVDALADAWSDAEKLVEMWCDQVSIDSLR
jgi:hypothetical protein